MTIGAARPGEGIAAVERDAQATERGGADCQRHQDRRDARPRESARRRATPPIPASKTSMITATTIEFPTRPAMKAQGGIGVPAAASAARLAGDRQRASPASAPFAEITESVMIAGT